MGSAMTWDVNNRLTSITGTTAKGTADSVTYTYLSDGSRRTKTVNGVTTTYHYNNGLLLSQTTDEETIRFYYDSTGKVVSLGYQKGTGAEVGYFFARNGQGDIVAVYRSSDSKLIGTYEYDLWGRTVSVTEATAGIDTDGILSKNPLRYRGYYFDSETGFYYLQSRYYDAGVRRFISADSLIASVGSSVQGHNLFAYCFNNPINMMDETGYWPIENAFWNNPLTKRYLKVAGSCVIAFLGTAKKAVKEDIASFDIHNESEEKVLNSTFFSCYKGKFVFRTAMGSSGFSFGVIFLGNELDSSDIDMLQHEYGHTLQLEDKGVLKYTTEVVLPSVLAYYKWQKGELPYEYYNSPWEAEADQLGGVNRIFTDEPWPEDAYWELFKLYIGMGEN